MTKQLAVALLWTAASLAAADGPNLYMIASTGSEGPSQFGRLNAADGSFFLIRNYEGVYLGLARSGNFLYTVDGDGLLSRIDPDTGSLTRVGLTGVQKGGPFNQAFYVFGGTTSGGLYGIDFHTNLWRINRESGVATMVGSTGLPGILSDRNSTSLAGDDNNLYFTLEIARPTPEPPFPEILPPALYRIDPQIGRAVRIADAPPFVVGSAFANGKLFLFPFALDDEGVPHGNDRVLEVDPRTGQAKPLAQPAPCMAFGYGGVVAPSAPARSHGAELESAPRSFQESLACRAGKGYPGAARQ